MPSDFAASRSRSSLPWSLKSRFLHRQSRVAIIIVHWMFSPFRGTPIRPSIVGSPTPLRGLLRDNSSMDEYDKDLSLRQFPKVATSRPEISNPLRINEGEI